MYFFVSLIAALFPYQGVTENMCNFSQWNNYTQIDNWWSSSLSNNIQSLHPIPFCVNTDLQAYDCKYDRCICVHFISEWIRDHNFNRFWPWWQFSYDHDLIFMVHYFDLHGSFHMTMTLFSWFTRLNHSTFL